MRRGWTRLAVGGVALGMAVALAGCGSSSTGSSPKAGGSSAKVTIDNALGVKYAGGTAGKKADTSLSPIKVGTVNMEGGTVSDPEAAVAMKAAFAYVNDQLGGIGGHPVELVACGAANTEEDVQKCAQQMLNDKSVSVVVEGGLNFGTQVIHSVLGEAKPVVEAESNPGPDTTAPNAFSTNASAIAIINGFGLYTKANSFKTVAMVGGDGTGDQAIASIIKKQFEGNDAKVKYVTFPENGTDLLTPFTAAGATTADVVAPAVVQPPQCVAAAKALDQLAVAPSKVIGVGLCASSAVKKLLGTWPKWTYLNTLVDQNAPDPTGQVKLYKAIMAKYAPAGAELGVNAPFSFGAALATVNVLNTVGPDKVTPAAVSAQFKTFAGPVLLGPPSLKFGSIPGMPAIGSVASRAYKFDGSKWSAVGSWLE